MGRSRASQAEVAGSIPSSALLLRSISSRVVALGCDAAVEREPLEVEADRADLAGHRLGVELLDVLRSHSDQGDLQRLEVARDLSEVAVPRLHPGTSVPRRHVLEPGATRR